jgi:hypothetical protein
MMFASKNDHKRKWQSQEVWVVDKEREFICYDECLVDGLEQMKIKISSKIKALQALLDAPIYYAVFHNDKQISDTFDSYEKAKKAIPSGFSSTETIDTRCSGCKERLESCYCNIVEIKIGELKI